MWRHIWNYTVCLCPIKRTPGLCELGDKLYKPKQTEVVEKNALTCNYSDCLWHLNRMNMQFRKWLSLPDLLSFEPRHEQTGFLPTRKQRRRSAVQIKIIDRSFGSS